MYVDEDQWERAVKAAESELELLYSQGMIDVPTGPVNGTLHRVAVSIARRALLAATEPEGDVSDLPGVRIDEIADPLMRKIRYLDKLVDELAKGRPMEKILRA